MQKNHSLAVAGAAAAVLLLSHAPSAEAKVVLAKKETKKVFQAEKVKRDPPTFTGKKKAKKSSSGGKSFSALSAPSISVPTIGGGPLAALPFIFGGSAFFAACFFAANNADEGFMDFIEEAMAKDVTTFVGTESEIKTKYFK
jgi:hypothetical protein